MKRKILVTGANGQLGCEIRDLAPSTGDQFFFTDIDELDLSSKSDANSYLNKIAPNYIINCAAYTAVDAAESDMEGAIRGNVGIPEILIDYAVKNETRIIHISTDYVFPGTADKPLIETDETAPESNYGKTKLDGEKIILSYEQSLVIRTSWLYSSYGKNFIKTMVRMMSEREELRIVNDQHGTPTYARDLALAILKIIGKPTQKEDAFRSGIYHYSNDGQTTWYDVTREIKDFLKSDCKIKPIATEEYPLPAPRPMYSVLNKEKIKQDFDVEVPFWKDSLIECLQKITANNI